MPASTTTTAPKKPTFSDVKINDALSKATTKTCEDFAGTNFSEIVELICKLMSRKIREELKL